MKRSVRIAAALAACTFLSGCAASRPEAKKEEPPGLSVRLPVADAATLNIESSGRPSGTRICRSRWPTNRAAAGSPSSR